MQKLVDNLSDDDWYHDATLQTVLTLYIASVIADCFSSLTLLYLGNNSMIFFSPFLFQCKVQSGDEQVICAVVLGTMTLPALYERYESEVDHLVARGVHDLRTQFAQMDSGVLRKIPRGTGAATKY